MALKVNGVEPSCIKVVKNGVVTELNALKVCAQNSSIETFVWSKPYSLKKVKDANCNVEAKRTASPKAGAPCNVYLRDGDVVYHGDSVAITAHPASGYKSALKINGAAQGASSITVTVNSDLRIETESSLLPRNLLAPIFKEESFVFDPVGRYYHLRVLISNPNEVNVSAKFVAYSNGGKKEHEQTVALNEGAMITYNYEMYSDGAMLTVEFSAVGCNNSFNSIKFGNYSGGVIYPDETSTTTTT